MTFTSRSLAEVSQLHLDKLSSGDWGLYFHGTATAFEHFDFDKCGTGSDANSALGFFVTPSLAGAADYADMVREVSAGAVLLVLVRETRPYEFDSFEDFYGADWPTGEATHDRQHFSELRQALMGAGHASAWFNLDDAGAIGVALSSEHAVVLGAMPLDQALNWATESELLDSGADATTTPYKQDVIAEAQQQLDSAICLA